MKEVGAASLDELAVKLNRAGDDLSPDSNLLKRNLLETKKFTHGDEEFEVYLTNSEIRPLL